MFSYPFGTLSCLSFTRVELHALIPLMKKKCIRTENEFNRAFANSIKWSYNRTEMYSSIVSSTGRIRQAVLNQFKTSWLAQKHNYSMAHVVFFQDKIANYFTQLQTREVDFNVCPLDIDNPLSKGDVLGVHVDFSLRSYRIHLNREQYIECPITTSTNQDLNKLKKYMLKLIHHTIRSQICLTVPTSSFHGDPVKASFPVKLNGYSDDKGCLVLNANQGVDVKVQYTIHQISLEHHKRWSDSLIPMVNAVYAELLTNRKVSASNIQRTINELYNFVPLKPVTPPATINIKSSRGIDINISPEAYDLLNTAHSDLFYNLEVTSNEKQAA